MICVLAAVTRLGTMLDPSTNAVTNTVTLTTLRIWYGCLNAKLKRNDAQLAWNSMAAFWTANPQSVSGKPKLLPELTRVRPMNSSRMHCVHRRGLYCIIVVQIDPWRGCK